MGPADTSNSGIERILIIGDNFPAPPIIHRLSHSTSPKYDLHVAHPHTPITPPHQSTTYHKIKLTPGALFQLCQDLKPDIAISTHPSTSNPTVVDALVEVGVPRFVPYDFGHDSLNPAIQDRLAYAKEKAKTISHLQHLAAEGKLSFCAIAVGTVLDRGLLSNNLGFDLAWRSATFHGKGDTSFPASSSSWIGSIVLAILRHWDDSRVKNQYVHLSGMTTTAEAVLTCLGHEMRTHWSAERGDNEDLENCVREAEKRIERGFPDAGMFLMERSVLYDARLDAAGAFEAKEARELKSVLALGDESEERIVSDVLHEFEHHGGKREGCGCG